MTEAQHQANIKAMTASYANKLIGEINSRMTNFGDSFEKARSVVSITAFCSNKCWAIVDAHFNQVVA